MFETEIAALPHTVVVRVAPRLHGGAWECSRLVKTADGFISEERDTLPLAPADWVGLLGAVERCLDHN